MEKGRLFIDVMQVKHMSPKLELEKESGLELYHSELILPSTARVESIECQ